jgi:predicted RNA-binding Zn-ribbon protein involved in translation (DUF1610 family)
MVVENPSARAEEARNPVADRLEARRPDWLIDCERALDDARQRLASGEFDQPMQLAVYFAPLSTPPISPWPNVKPNPVPMLLWCPQCGERHIDKGEFADTKHHHTHACQSCGMVWRPTIGATVGVQFLPGFKDET